MGIGSIRSFTRDGNASIRSEVRSRASRASRLRRELMVPPSPSVSSAIGPDDASSRYHDAVQDSAYDAYGYEEFRSRACYEDEINNHKVALERKLNNYDYQDISDFKNKSSRSARLRASISGAATVKSGSSRRTSESAKAPRESGSQQHPGMPPRRYSSSAVSRHSLVVDSMSINMHSVALSSVHQKHMHVGSMETGSGQQTNYDKQRVRMYTEKRALGGPKTAYDMARMSQQKKPEPHRSLRGHSSGQNRPRNSSSRSVRSLNSVSSNPYRTPSRMSNSYANSSANSYANNSANSYANSYDQRSAVSQKSSATSLKQKQHRRSTSSYYDDEDSQMYLIGKDSCVSLHDEIESLLDDMSSTFDKPKLSTSSTPITSPECLPLNKPTKFDANLFLQNTAKSANYHLSSIVEVATPKESTFRQSTYSAGHKPIPEEPGLTMPLNIARKTSMVSMAVGAVNKKSSRLSLRSRKSNVNMLNNTPGSPKAVFSLEDTLRADEDFRNNLPTKAELHASVEVNLTKKAQTPGHKKPKKHSNGGFKAFLGNLFGSKKDGSIDKKKIQVLNQRIGVC